MAVTRKNYLGFDTYLQSPEWKIRVEASEMLSYFLEIGKELPNYREWKSSFRKRLNDLYLTCEQNQISPYPEELRELERHLSRRKKDVYPAEKSFVSSWLAWNFDPDELKTKRNEIIRQGNAALDDLGGLRVNMRGFQVSSERNEFEQTIKRLIADKQFLKGWREKRDRYNKLQQRNDMDKAIEISKAAIKEPI